MWWMTRQVLKKGYVLGPSRPSHRRRPYIVNNARTDHGSWDRGRRQWLYDGLLRYAARGGGRCMERRRTGNGRSPLASELRNPGSLTCANRMKSCFAAIGIVCYPKPIPFPAKS